MVGSSLGRRAPVVLIVEDNSDDEMMTVRALKKELGSARLSVARDGQKALECVQGMLTIDGEQVEAPDLIILDFKLPFYSGLDVLRAVRDCESTRCVPVVLFSSSDDESDIGHCYRAGANTYVKKPVDYEEYMRVVRSLANYWFSVARLPASCPESLAA